MNSKIVIYFTVDIASSDTNISLKKNNYDITILSKKDNILLFSLALERQTENNKIFLTLLLGKDTIDIEEDIDDVEDDVNFISYTNRKELLYLRFKNTLDYIDSEHKELLIDTFYEFLQMAPAKSEIESNLVISLIYHSFGTEYFNDIINFVDNKLEFFDEFNLNNIEYYLFFSHILENKDINQEIKNKLFKIFLFFFYNVDKEKFINLFFSEKSRITNNYSFIFQNKKLFKKCPDFIIVKGLFLFDTKDELINILSLINSFTYFLEMIDKFFNKLKNIISCDNIFPLFEINNIDNNKINYIFNSIHIKIRGENKEKQYIYLTFLQRLIFDNIKGKNEFKLFFSYIENSKKYFPKNNIYIIKNLEEFYNNGMKNAIFNNDILIFVQKIILPYLSYLPKSLNINIISYINFETITQNELVTLNKIVDIIAINFPLIYIGYL